LEAAEVELTQARVEQFKPDFDDISRSALRHIHRFLFQDVHEWAGELLAVDISKGSPRFANVSRVEPEAEKLFRQMTQENYLVDLPREKFVSRLAHYYSELNVASFRDGNGRAQRLLFESSLYECRLPGALGADRADGVAGGEHRLLQLPLEPPLDLLDRVLMPI